MTAVSCCLLIPLAFQLSIIIQPYNLFVIPLFPLPQMYFFKTFKSILDPAISVKTAVLNFHHPCQRKKKKKTQNI